MSNDLTLHATQRIKEHTCYSLADVQELWQRGRTATITDLTAFCTWRRPDTECRIAVSRGQCVLLVRSLTTGRLITIFQK